MKKIELYVCEKCETQYKYAASAAMCEENHKPPVSISKARYISYGSDKTGYPTSITVKFDDDKELIYRR